MGTAGSVRESSPPHCCSCLPCAQTGVLSGVVMQGEDLFQLPVWPDPSNLF
jgi:hypothetical protein